MAFFELAHPLGQILERHHEQALEFVGGSGVLPPDLLKVEAFLLAHRLVDEGDEGTGVDRFRGVGVEARVLEFHAQILYAEGGERDDRNA